MDKIFIYSFCSQILIQCSFKQISLFYLWALPRSIFKLFFLNI